jgi:hypothetical protein
MSSPSILYSEPLEDRLVWKYYVFFFGGEGGGGDLRRVAGLYFMGKKYHINFQPDKPSF